MRRIEALADALASLHSAGDPDSEAYWLRNPIMLRSFLPKHENDGNGNRKFKTLVAGYENAIYDLRLKCSGRSHANVKPESSLVALLSVYGQPPTAVRYVLKFLRRALRTENLPEDLKIQWFLEEEHVDASTVDHPTA